ncbi:MAG: DNA translocase FtsK 4TM domain-containing protein, partial [Burkholderiaceae bacterium]
MTYSLHTLNPDADDASARASGRGAQPLAVGAEALLILSGVLLLFWVVVLFSHSAADAAWSTSGSSVAGAGAQNWGGKIGAWVSDLSFYLLGYSVWWCVLVAGLAWLRVLLRWLHSDRVDQGGADHVLATTAAAPGRALPAWWPWLALALLLMASCALEWTRLYRFEPRLPGHAGGVLGYLVGPMSVRALGFNGSALMWIALGVVAAAGALGFSWTSVAERIGTWVEGFFAQRRERRELAEDLAAGEQAARERAEVVAVEREAVEEERVAPVLIEPVVAEVPKSERVAKERQKPLFSELPDSKLPQVDLLDGAQARQETVSPETLEMTSRLIEKKLKDFGVEVRVVLAQPGPVITRYEIEPATGVKGSQIVNLAKDLARSLSLVSIRVIETIPGKNYMALELPNAKRQSIRLSEILGSQVYNDAKSMLTMGLGKDIVGNPVVADLAK